MTPGVAHKMYAKSKMSKEILWLYKDANIRVLSVRHPIERFISAYHMFCTEDEEQKFGLAKKKDWLKKILKYLCDRRQKEGSNNEDSQPCDEESIRGKGKYSNYWLSLNNLAIFMFTQPENKVPDLFGVHMLSQLTYQNSCYSCSINYDYIIKTLTMSEDWKYLSDPSVNERKDLNLDFAGLNNEVNFSSMVNHNDNGLGIDVSGLVEKLKVDLMEFDEDILDLVIEKLGDAMEAFGYGIDRGSLELTGLVD